MTTAQDGGKVVNLTHWPPLPQEIHLVLISVRGWVPILFTFYIQVCKNLKENFGVKGLIYQRRMYRTYSNMGTWGKNEMQHIFWFGKPLVKRNCWGIQHRWEDG